MGEGEKKKELSNLIKKLNLKDVRLEGYKSNVYDYYKSCFCFILSSLWEDPGFVLVEAAFANAPIISSNCPNGPSEFIGQNEAGYIYESNNSNSFLNTFDNFYNTPEKQKLNKKIIAKKKTKMYTKFKHYKKYIKNFKYLNFVKNFFIRFDNIFSIKSIQIIKITICFFLCY